MVVLATADMVSASRSAYNVRMRQEVMWELIGHSVTSISMYSMSVCHTVVHLRSPLKTKCLWLVMSLNGNFISTTVSLLDVHRRVDNKVLIKIVGIVSLSMRHIMNSLFCFPKIFVYSWKLFCNFNG